MNCGFPLETAMVQCPKCDSFIKDQFYDTIVTIDIAHHGETWPEAKEKLDNAIDNALRDRVKGLRIIHGLGSEKGFGGIIRRATQEYLQSRKRALGAKITSEKGNDGVTLLYLRSQGRK